jgi:hypothetical protein
MEEAAMRYSCPAVLAGVLVASVPSGAQQRDTAATRELEARDAEFVREIIEVTADVYTAIGIAYRQSP